MSNQIQPFKFSLPMTQITFQSNFINQIFISTTLQSGALAVVVVCDPIPIPVQHIAFECSQLFSMTQTHSRSEAVQQRVRRHQQRVSRSHQRISRSQQKSVDISRESVESQQKSVESWKIFDKFQLLEGSTKITKKRNSEKHSEWPNVKQGCHVLV